MTLSLKKSSVKLQIFRIRNKSVNNLQCSASTGVWFVLAELKRKLKCLEDHAAENWITSKAVSELFASKLDVYSKFDPFESKIYSISDNTAGDEQQTDPTEETATRARIQNIKSSLSYSGM